MLFCKDCKHHEKTLHEDYYTHECYYGAKEAKPEPVNGNEYMNARWLSCWWLRKLWWKCGTKAKWFERKEQ